MSEQYDVIVIGAGHAGAEAAALASRMGARTLLLTQNLETVGQMSCNPAIGGIAKGTVVREVDALGGIMGRATDLARIQFRMLNRSKGPAVWSPRAQCDRGLYRRAVRLLLEQLPRLDLVQGTVAGLRMLGDVVAGVVTTDGRTFSARSVVVTTGTFLRGRIHVGRDTRIPAGRAGDQPSVELAQALEEQGVTLERFKTGTPPRADGRTIDFGRLERQDGDSAAYWFSHFASPCHPEQRPCYLTWTTPRLREIITRHLAESALYGGMISSRGPRYCPSIEDKIVKFPDAERHQVFLEPEGLDTSEMYVNGLSTSLPAEVQLSFLRSIPGLEQVRMTRLGYAIEYDYVPPLQLRPSLELRSIHGLFLAGQINGTTGYEEAAGQGAVAGINSAARALDREPVVLSRDTAFIGVLIDDLVSRGVDEPYRLFTSRSEFRLLLRQDNALRRLLPLVRNLGLLQADELLAAESRLEAEERALRLADTTVLTPEQANSTLADVGATPVASSQRVSELARRPGVKLADLLRAGGLEDDMATEWADIELKYGGYLSRERRAAQRMTEMDGLRIPANLRYEGLHALSFEARQKLSAARPETLGQAGRIPGVSPSDLQNLVLAVVKSRK
jgi:tRNA uridine 5-carboxymethylaminomethyl modification enzyme